VSLADGHLVHAYEPQMPQAAAFQSQAKGRNMHLLDRAPTHPQVPGHILDGHARHQPQNVPAQSLGPAALRIADQKGLELQHPTGPAPQAVKVDLSQRDPLGKKHDLLPDGQCPKPTTDPALPGGIHSDAQDISGPTISATPLSRTLLNVEDQRAANKLGPQITIAANSKSVVHYTRGHRIPPSLNVFEKEVS